MHKSHNRHIKTRLDGRTDGPLGIQWIYKEELQISSLIRKFKQNLTTLGTDRLSLKMKERKTP